MSRVEDLLRDTLSVTGAAGAPPAGLADAAITGATRVRRRRRMAAAGGLVVILLLGTVATVRLGSQQHGAPAGPVDGPVLMDTYGEAALLTASGLRVGLAPDGRPPVAVSRVAGGWLVQGEVVYLLTEDGTRRTVMDPRTVPGLKSWMVQTGGDRVAVHTESATENVLTVYSLPSGEVLGTTTGPGGTDGPIMKGFVGPDVVLASRSLPAQELTDVWDPTSGPYLGTPATRRTWLLPGYTAAADALVLEPGLDPDQPCLVRLDRARGYAPTAMACDLGLRWDGRVSLSPDGTYLLIAGPDGPGVLPVAEALDGERPARTALPLGDLFGGPWQGDLWWESRDTVLLSPDIRLDGLVRCRLVDVACAVVPTPEVDGAPAQGLVPWVPIG